MTPAARAISSTVVFSTPCSNPRSVQSFTAAFTSSWRVRRERSCTSDERRGPSPLPFPLAVDLGLGVA